MTNIDTASLTTDRLRLDPLHVSDAAEMVAVLGSYDLYTFTGGTPPMLGDLELRYTTLVAGSPSPGVTWRNWTIRLASGDAVGFVQATVNDEAAEVAWLIATTSQGLGFASEAATEMCRWLSSVGVTEHHAHIHPDHLASQRVAEKIGFARTARRDADGEDIWVLRAPPTT